MQNKFTVIDTATWKRRSVYRKFIGYTNPVFSLSTRLDVTPLFMRCATRGTSFFTDFLYIVTTCLNDVEEFRLRIADDKVVLFDRVEPSFVVMADDGFIVTARTRGESGYAPFYAATRAAIERARQSSGAADCGDDSADCFYVSCLPWADIRSIINPYDLKDVCATSIPRITWGAYADNNGRKEMTLDISAHHALIDGEPLCRTFRAIQSAIFGGDEWFAAK